MGNISKYRPAAPAPKPVEVPSAREIEAKRREVREMVAKLVASGRMPAPPALPTDVVLTEAEEDAWSDARERHCEALAAAIRPGQEVA